MQLSYSVYSGTSTSLWFAGPAVYEYVLLYWHTAAAVGCNHPVTKTKNMVLECFRKRLLRKSISQIIPPLGKKLRYFCAICSLAYNAPSFHPTFHALSMPRIYYKPNKHCLPNVACVHATLQLSKHTWTIGYPQWSTGA